jgi:hypothetical protein
VDDLAVADSYDAEGEVPVGRVGGLGPSVVGDLGDDDLGIVGLADHRLDAVHDEQVAGPAQVGEEGADGVAAAEFGGLAGEAERVGEHAVLGEQAGELDAFAGHHAADLFGDLAGAAGHEMPPIIGTVTPFELYGTIAPVSNRG